MKLSLVVLVICLLGELNAKSKKKSIKDELSTPAEQHTISKSHNKSKMPPAAIVAIEIVDPDEDKSKSKNSKRTIDSSLGYGYKSFYGATNQKPKFETYKYSQHDIPPYRGPAKNLLSGGIKTHNYDFQKSVSYKLPSIVETKYTNAVTSSPQQQYQPGTILFSTLNHQGQLEGISSQVPQDYGSHNEDQVPVIIFRVYPNQLIDPASALHPNLPKSHPLATNLNSINLQDLLATYLQPQVVQPPPQTQQHPEPVVQSQPVYEQHYEDNYQYQQPQYEQPQYQQPQYQFYQPTQSSKESSSELLTHENYPSDAHTRVIFKTQNGKIRTSNKQTESPPVQTKTIKIEVPPGISGVEVQTPESHYSYSNQLPEGNQGYQYTHQGDVGQQYYYIQQEQTYQSYPEPTQQQYEGNAQEYSNPVQYETTQRQVQYKPAQQMQYQQIVYHQPSEVQPSQPTNVDTHKVYNYHAHQKRRSRSKKGNQPSATKQDS